MDRRFNTHPLFVTDAEAKPGPASPSSGDDAKTEAPSPKKRKGMTKRVVVTQPIAEVDGSKSKGETYPPSDSWAWRKYGQKPIKGSPYPRGYYRCSSSKGCPARKQVERSRVDPTMLVVTYAHDHDHSVPVGKSHSSTSNAAAAAEAATPSSSSDGVGTSAADYVSRFPPEELTVFAGHPDLELAGESAVLLSDQHHHHHHHGEFGWLDDVASTGVLESPILGEVEDATLTMKEEDESLFADLGELPECSAVFRRRNMGRSSAIQCGGITG